MLRDLQVLIFRFRVEARAGLAVVEVFMAYDLRLRKFLLQVAQQLYECALLQFGSRVGVNDTAVSQHSAYAVAYAYAHAVVLANMRALIEQRAACLTKF